MHKHLVIVITLKHLISLSTLVLNIVGIDKEIYGFLKKRA